jgi:hypothetical protein
MLASNLMQFLQFIKTIPTISIAPKAAKDYRESLIVEPTPLSGTFSPSSSIKAWRNWALSFRHDFESLEVHILSSSCTILAPPQLSAVFVSMRTFIIYVKPWRRQYFFVHAAFGNCSGAIEFVLEQPRVQGFVILFGLPLHHATERSVFPCRGCC